MTSDQPLLRMKSIGKQFPGVIALHNVDLEVSSGEVLGIVGENGAGKSTLLKILGGILRPDEGHLWIDGNCRLLQGVRDAQANGIGLIDQELKLAQDLSIGENLFLGHQPLLNPRWLQIIDRRQLFDLSNEVLRLLDPTLSPGMRVSELSIAQQQVVEIAKALTINARILVFDEPTSSLSQTETDRLLTLIAKLKSRGTAIIYVSHRLEEVIRISDRVCVIRDGQLVATMDRQDITQERLINHMVGRSLNQFYPEIQRATCEEPPALEIHNLVTPRSSAPVSFVVYPGEIVGVAGLMGAGRTELARAIFGVEPAVRGAIRLQGVLQEIKTPSQAIAAGIALAPEDRKGLGLFLSMSVTTNLCVVVLNLLSKFGWYNRRKEKNLAKNLRKSFNIKTPSLTTVVSSLSGGNQQKIVLAKWLAANPQVLLLDEPTRGVDVGARQEVYRLIKNLAEKGMAVLLISSELEELLGLSHRILVMKAGRIVGDLVNERLDQETIMTLAVEAAH